MSEPISIDLVKCMVRQLFGRIKDKSADLHSRYQAHKRVSQSFYTAQLLLGSTTALTLLCLAVLRLTRRARRARRHRLQLEQSYRKFHHNLRFGIDIGGTLCKLVIYEPYDVGTDAAQIEYKRRVSEFLRSSTTYGETGRRDVSLEHHNHHIKGVLHFVKFPTSSMSRFIDMVTRHKLVPDTVYSDTDNILNINNTQPNGDLTVSNEMTDSTAMRMNGSAASQHTDSNTAVDSDEVQPASMQIQLQNHVDDTIQRNGSNRSLNDKSNTNISSDTLHSMHNNGVNRIQMKLDPYNHNNNAMLPLRARQTSGNNALFQPSESPVFPTFNSMWDAKPAERASSAPAFDLNSQKPYNGAQTQQSDTTPLPADEQTPDKDSKDKSSSKHHTTTQYYNDTGVEDKRVPSVCATGGGAYKFASLLRQKLKIRLCITDELGSLVKGIDILLHSYPHECYYLKKFRFRERIETANYDNIKYPYLVVNIGSGVSILRVSGSNDFKRVGGTSLGGGTFYGLCRALTNCVSFQQALEWAELGRSSPVDLLVGDIYGGDYKSLNLPADTVASSFGKLVRPNAFKDVRKEDLAKACLIMITNNIGSLANLYAHKVMNWTKPQIIFVGNFLNDNDVAKRTLAYATDYWSGGTAQALFLKHEGYFGAVGALC